MKTWNITSAKFYSEIMNGVAAFFGLSEEATEAEIHQQLIEAGSLAEIRAAALKEANEAVAQQMADFQQKLDALQTGFDAMKADAATKSEKVDELTEALEKVQSQAAEKDTEIESLRTHNISLSGEVAGLKAGKPIDKNTPPDASKATILGNAPKGGVVVSGNEIEEAYKKLAGMN